MRLIDHPCYLCHGEKLIEVKREDGSRYMGCPACKRNKTDVIGEGFAFPAQQITDNLLTRLLTALNEGK